MKRSELIGRMHRAGLRLDDASVAADVAVAAIRVERDRLIVAAKAAEISLRKTAAIVGVSHIHVRRVLRKQAG